MVWGFVISPFWVWADHVYPCILWNLPRLPIFWKQWKLLLLIYKSLIEMELLARSLLSILVQYSANSSVSDSSIKHLHFNPGKLGGTGSYKAQISIHPSKSSIYRTSSHYSTFIISVCFLQLHQSSRLEIAETTTIIQTIATLAFSLMIGTLMNESVELSECSII